MLAPSIAFVDLETTGANPAVDRITEIAIVKISDGQLEYEWSQLIDPEVPIPPLIQRFTGISDDMVRGAPLFGRIADELRERLAGCLFVAHNARFDYGFLKNEFKRLNQSWSAPVLCTVKLSRALYPQHHRHGLDALIARHELACSARHRALGDAQVLWDFVQLVERTHSAEVIEQAIARAMKRSSVPPGVPADLLDGLPDAPGVYLFYGAAADTAPAREAAAASSAEMPLYVGKSVNIRTRVLAHFNADQRAGRQMELARAVRRVECIETAGELGALLAEARLIKTLRPLFNRKLRAQGELCAWRLTPGSIRCALELVPFAEAAIDDLPALHGPFKSRRDAQHMLRELATAYLLCPKRLGLESGNSGACIAVQLKRCAGVCCGRESIEAHDARLAGALAASRLKRWPYAGRIALREHDPERDRSAFHVFDSWCHLGTAQDEAELHELAAARVEPRFDLDTYRILLKQLEAPSARLTLVPLPHGPADPA